MHGGGMKLLGIRADTNDEITRLPVVVQFGIIKFQGVGGDLENHFFALAGREADLLETAQVLHAAGHAGDRLGEIELHNFLAGIAPVVGDGDGGG